MGKINILPFAVANLIAAGEVVDRPASVIKELMENSIDAGATRITVEIQNGGVTFMRVSDNGCGMEPDELPVALHRHATSKIKCAEDLVSITLEKLSVELQKRLALRTVEYNRIGALVQFRVRRKACTARTDNTVLLDQSNKFIKVHIKDLAFR